MLGRKTILLMLALSLAVLPGCWSRKELNELAVVMALGIDLDKEGYAVTAQVMNSSAVGSQKVVSSSSLPVISYKATGKTVPDALQRMLSMTPRMLYLSHIRVLVFGEALARKGVSDALDYISRNHQLRNDFYLLVAKNSAASEILEVITPFEHIPANSLFSSILVSHKKWAATGKITLQQFIIELERSGSNPILSGVRLHGPLSEGQSEKNVQNVRPKAQIQHAGMAVFKHDKLVGWLGETTSKTVNYLLNEVDSTMGNVNCPGGGTVGFTVSSTKSDYKVKLGSDGRPEFDIKLVIEATLSVLQCTIDLSKPSNLNAIARQMEQEYNRDVAAEIRRVQQDYGSDIFGFGEALHRQYPNKWKQYRNNWEQGFKASKINVHTEVAVRRIGSILQPLRKEMEDR